MVKAHLHRGEEPRLYHFRDAKGLEVDLVLDGASRDLLIGIMSGRTIADDFFSGLLRLGESATRRGKGASVEPILVYGGDEAQRRRDARVVPWSRLDQRRGSGLHHAARGVREPRLSR